MRGAHLHSREAIDSGDRLSWLALMQHHGTPTRLLDWTESPYVALYFAVEPKEEEGKHPCIWVIDWQMLEFGTYELWRRLEESGKRKDALDFLGTLRTVETPERRAEYFNRHTANGRPLAVPGIVAVRPFKLHQRLIAQQGLFLVPFDSSKPFSDSLLQIARFRLKGTGPLDTTVFKIELKNCNRLDLLRRLWSMNINHATLYPGLDGFAHSLQTRFELEGADNRL